MKLVVLLALLFLLNPAVGQTSNINDTSEVSDELLAEIFGRADQEGGADNRNTTQEVLDQPSTDGSNSTDTDSCVCVPSYICTNNTMNRAGGFKVINIRIENNPCDILSVCCNIEDTSDEPVTSSPDNNKPRVHACGKRNLDGVGFRIADTKVTEAQYGEFPWMVAVFREESFDETSIAGFTYRCGASLIHPQVALTSAHCVYDENKRYKIRAGEWDMQIENELFPHQDRDVKTVIVHPQYYSAALFNDIALLILDSPLELWEHIGIVCLPKQGMNISESRCWASGWGKDASDSDGRYQDILKKIDLPIVPRNVCQDQLRKTRLKERFQLHSSFICAGGEPGRDTCYGDGGSPLVCPIPEHPGRYVQAGIVAWGIGCGGDHIPGVYADVAMFSDWIDEQLTNNNFNTSAYRY